MSNHIFLGVPHLATAEADAAALLHRLYPTAPITRLRNLTSGLETDVFAFDLGASPLVLRIYRKDDPEAGAKAAIDISRVPLPCWSWSA